MRILGYYWGIAGVVLLLLFAVVRLTPHALALQAVNLNAGHWLLLLVWVPFMLYSEGYRGFHLNFAPRVVARARALSDAPRPLLVLLAPLVCMGFIHATNRRKLISLLLTLMIVMFVLVVSRLTQPWRGIIDAGVVLGLMIGIGSILWYWSCQRFRGIDPPVAADMPDS